MIRRPTSRVALSLFSAAVLLMGCGGQASDSPTPDTEDTSTATVALTIEGMT